MKKVIYILAAALGGFWLGKLAYTSYAYVQLITVGDTIVGGLAKYQLVGFLIGMGVGRYWQTHYEYWGLMNVAPHEKKR